MVDMDLVWLITGLVVGFTAGVNVSIAILTRRRKEQDAQKVKSPTA